MAIGGEKNFLTGASEQQRGRVEAESVADVVHGGFEWSTEKARRNAQEHLIDFEEAAYEEQS